MVEVMKIIVTSFKRSHGHTAALSASDSEAGHHRPMPPLDTPGHSQASLGQFLVGVTAPFSWVLVHTTLCLCCPRDYFPDLLSSGSSVVGLMETSSKRAYVIPKSAAPRAPAPVADHC